MHLSVSFYVGWGVIYSLTILSLIGVLWEEEAQNFSGVTSLGKEFAPEGANYFFKA